MNMITSKGVDEVTAIANLRKGCCGLKMNNDASSASKLISFFVDCSLASSYYSDMISVVLSSSFVSSIAVLS